MEVVVKGRTGQAKRRGEGATPAGKAPAEHLRSTRTPKQLTDMAIISHAMMIKSRLVSP